MFRRLFTAYLALLVVALGVFGLWSAHATRERVLDEIAQRLQAEAGLVAGVAQREPAALQAMLREMGRRTETRLTVIAPDGKVLADSHADPSSMENHNTRPEVQQARAEGRGRQVRTSETVRYEMMYLALRLERGMVVRSALPVTRVDAELAALTRGILIAFLAVGLAGAGVTFLVARWITGPLRTMRDVAQAVAAGDFARRAPLSATDELGSVSAAMNRMAEELSVRLERLTVESSKLEAVLSSLQDGVLALDPAGRILRYNQAAQQLLPLGTGSAGLPVWEAIRLPGLESMARATGRHAVEWEDRSLLLSFRPQAGAGGSVLVVRDVTEDQRYDRLRKEFVANVSHELRTPLTVISGYVETLKDGALGDAEHAPKFLESIEKNVRRLAALVEDLLELSRLESGAPLLKPGKVEPRALLEKVAEDLRPLAERKGQRLEVVGKAGPLEADPELLERALRNLVDNAIKYTPEGGTVTLRAPEEGVFEVEDTGLGIPAEDLPRVFERFYRVDKSRSRELGGTGLGLAIVKHVAQLHGGSVSVESRVGKGSLFRLRLKKTV